MSFLARRPGDNLFGCISDKEARGGKLDRRQRLNILRSCWDDQVF
jgi:hypothetical protein